ncbi:MAG TPA: pitrilysin family protein [Thermoanaerobaculia bacterium]|nr:pitrilysin family protein [Thermoanaerobaculia bacterium]
MASPAASPGEVAVEPDFLLRLPGSIRLARLANGLTVCLLENRQAPLVTCALYYRAGTRDEAAGHGGVAHFLEHMMFKGSARFGPGEIDRRTQALGGVNNAFTGHDTTAYYFNFAADRWTEALAIEADRMAGLTLDPEQVASERQVILEEIAMYESEPWDALEMEVQARLFGAHPYGRPVLGSRDELLASGAAELADFHHRFYRPGNAAVVIAGDVGSEGLGLVDETLGRVPAGGFAGAARRPLAPPLAFPAALERVERHKGEVARLLLALPGPAGRHPDHPALRLLVTVLGSGRASRLHRSLVDEQQICVWVSADLSESLDGGHIAISAEVVPGIDPQRVEAELQRHLVALVAAPPSAAEVARARQIVLADWVFGHERVHQQALSAGFALALFDLEHLEQHLRATLAAGPERLHEIAQRYLRPERGGILGWSLPRAED